MIATITNCEAIEAERPEQLAEDLLADISFPVHHPSIAEHHNFILTGAPIRLGNLEKSLLLNHRVLQNVFLEFFARQFTRGHPANDKFSCRLRRNENLV